MLKNFYKLLFVVACMNYCSFTVSGQNVGVGTTSPANAKLQVEGSTSITQASFGPVSQANVSIDVANPFIGFNNYYNGSRKVWVPGYSAYIGFDHNAGKLSFNTSGAKYTSAGSAVAFSNAVTIDSNQNVGIGTANPTCKLHVVGPTSDNWLRLSSSGGAGFAFYAPSSYPTLGFNTEIGSSTYARMATGFASFFQYGPATGTLNYFSSSVSDNSGTAVSTSGATFQLTADGGMGIGGSNSNSRLTISHNSSIANPHLRLKESGNDYARIQLENSNSTRFWHIAGYTSASGAATDYLNIYHSTAGDVLSFKGDGTVGIGTNYTPAGYKVSINGKVICTELRVQTVGAWPDYVFAQNYQLQSLPDLEAYIQTNNHLPGVPAASEVETNGITVGDMQKRLMEKVEELTLYIIHQDKTIKAQETRIKILEQKNRYMP